MPTNIHTANRIFKNIILMSDKHNIPGGNMHSNCRLLPEDIVCKVTQGNSIGRADACGPVLKLLGEEMTSDIEEHKQNLWREHLAAQWDHRHNTHILWKTRHGLSNRAPPTTHNNSITFNNKITNTPKHIVSPGNSQTPSDTQHTGQAYPLTGKHKTYKYTTLHSPLLRTNRK